MSDPSPESRSTSEIQRLRDVLVLYGAALRNIPVLNTPDQLTANFVPRPSPDSILIALCQLTAIRLGAQRAMISLIDDKRQYVLSEATCDQSLRPHRLEERRNALWLGHVSIPRCCGLCEQVLDMNSRGTTVVIEDLHQFHQSAHKRDIQSAPNMCFYASSALFSPRGAVVGTICIYDDKQREGLSENERGLLADFANTIIEYLNTYTLKEKYRRGERFTRGLISFSEGGSSLVSFKRQDQLESAEGHDFSAADMEAETQAEQRTGTSGTTTEYEGASTSEAILSTDQSNPESSTTKHLSTSINSRRDRARSARHRSIRTLQESILPANSRSMFSRAANILMASSDLDGVLILDASVAANGGCRTSPGLDSSTEHASESYLSKTSSSETENPGSNNIRPGVSSSKSKLCQVLGVATQDRCSEYSALLEPDLCRLLRDCPHGKIFNFIENDILLPCEDSTSSSCSTSIVEENEFEACISMRRRKTLSSQARRSSHIIQSILPAARSVAFIPFWDYERSRWFAGCLCWTHDPHRLLSVSVDLPCFKVFGHSTMRELSRLDAIALKQSKTTFVSLISHELRSPLHGILGTLEFIKDTHLDSFQVSMLNSLSGCGQTLLDTINHIMDHSKNNEVRRCMSSRRLTNANTIRISCKPTKNEQNRHGAFDLSTATEEVIEAVFSGSTYVPLMPTKLENAHMSLHDIQGPTLKRKHCLVILDVAFENDWMFCFPIGSWKRIVMNLFGNAMKYTTSGSIHVSLQAQPIANTDIAFVTLAITDSGCGITPSFLANKAFHPFSQEDIHSTGTGLGLSIVRQIIETNGGKIQMRSDSTGTKVTVKLTLRKPNVASQAISVPRLELLSILPRLEGRRICVLQEEIPNPSQSANSTSTKKEIAQFSDGIAKTLRSQLKMDVVQTADWIGHEADIVIAPEISFEYLQTIRDRRKNSESAPVTIFIAIDAMEASTLRSDARVLNRQSVVEIMTQPCGPCKLACVLNRCLDRFVLLEENVQRKDEISSSPAALSTPRVLSQASTTFDTLKNPKIYATDPTAALIPPLPTVLTPLVTSPSPAPDPFQALQEKKESTMLYVLVTDNNLINRKLLAAFLKRKELRFAEAGDGLEALNAYKNVSTPFDVILMGRSIFIRSMHLLQLDIRYWRRQLNLLHIKNMLTSTDLSMPVMDGMTSTRAIREYERKRQLPRSCIVALTGLTSSSAKLEAWSSGIDYFLTKPVNFQSLEEILRKEERKRKGACAESERRKKRRGVSFSGDTKVATVV